VGDTRSVPGFGTVDDLVVTTQVWHGSLWQHVVRILKPAEVKYPGWACLFITGGSGPPEPLKERGDDAVALMFAKGMRAPVAVLYNLPNQPLFGNLREDAIISLTFQQFIKDGDPTWPLLFPMTKSALRAMDAVQQFAREVWRQEINSFMVTGASKRGWTTWLTAASDPVRVKAIAPMVIDTLNFPAQFAYEKRMWGTYSEAIADYTSKGLTEVFAKPRGRLVWAAVDPYTYRKRLTLPKLMILGANDQFWPTGALNVYWDSLAGPKAVIYAPNSTHGLEDRQRVFNTIGAFFRTVASGRALPQMSWKTSGGGSEAQISITAPEATGARVWVVSAANMDFRPQKWVATEMPGGNGTWTVTVPRPAGKNLAVFGEADFTADGEPYTLSTQTIILTREGKVF